MLTTALFSVRPPKGGAAGPAAARQRLSRLGFGIFLLASLAFTLPIGQGRAQPVREASAPVPESIAEAIDPSDWLLSPEAEHLYYYLLLTEGMAENSQPVISEALQGLLKSDPSLPVFQDSATILLSRGEFTAAEKLAEQGLARFSGDPLLTMLLAGAYSESGQSAKAISLLEEYLQKRPDAQDIIEELVRLYLNDGQDKKASELLARLPEEGMQEDSELFRARVLSSVGRFGEAKENLRRLLQKRPDFFEGWMELGLTSERSKDLDEALRAYEQAAQIASDVPEVYFRIALLQIQKKLPEEALKTLEKAAPSPGLYIQAALRFADGRFFKEAHFMLEKAAAAGANLDEIALFTSMFKQESSRNPLDALPALNSISPASKLYPSALQQKVRIYLQAKQYEKAYSIARDGRKNFPDQLELWGLEAFTLVKLKRPGEAEKLLKNALDHHPRDEQLMFSLATVLDESGRKEDAMKVMEDIITVNPKHFQALNYVGYTLAEKNSDLKRAHQLILAALEQNPDADYIVDSLAWVQFRMGRFDEAWSTINRCIELGGNEPTIWEHYGDIARALGKYAEAIKGYTEAILRQPDNITELRKKLTEMHSK